VDAAARLCTPAEQQRVARVPCPYGEGDTSDQVADLLADPGIRPLLELSEPDFVGKEPPS